MNEINLKSLNNENLVNGIINCKHFKKKINFRKLEVETCLGVVHILNAGNKEGRPVIIFHEENSTCVYCLNQYKSLLNDYNVYVCDITRQLGYLSKHTDSYGEWASDIIEGLGYKKMICIGESFGGQVIIKLMCFSPSKIIKSVLISPYGIIKVQRFKLFFHSMIPRFLYKLTKKQKFLYKSINAFVLCDGSKEECNELSKKVFNYVKPSAAFSETINPYDAAMCLSPTLVFAGEKDLIFSSSKLLKAAKDSFFNSSIYLIRNCAHIAFLSDNVCREINQEIIKFLKEDDDVSVIKYKDVVG